jgi:hypothetical protein
MGQGMLSVGILVTNNPVYNWEAVFCGLEGQTFGRDRQAVQQAYAASGGRVGGAGIAGLFTSCAESI